MNTTYYNLSDLKGIKIGDFNFNPVDASLLMDNQVIKTISLLYGQSPNVQKFLPNMDLSTEESTKKFFLKEAMSVEADLGFTYAIRRGNGPLGFVFVHTPNYNKALINYEFWTIDFFVFDLFSGQNIMEVVLGYLLEFLKNTIKVDSVYLLVSPENSNCISLVKKLGVFYEIDNAGFYDENGGSVPNVYRCDVSKLNIVKKSELKEELAETEQCCDSKNCEEVQKTSVEEAEKNDDGKRKIYFIAKTFKGWKKQELIDFCISERIYGDLRQNLPSKTGTAETPYTMEEIMDVMVKVDKINLYPSSDRPYKIENEMIARHKEVLGNNHLYTLAEILENQRQAEEIKAHAYESLKKALEEAPKNQNSGGCLSSIVVIIGIAGILAAVCC